MQQVKYLPKQQLDIEIKKLLDNDPNWSIKEIQAWLDYQALEDNKTEEQIERELVAAGGFSNQRGTRHIWAQIDRDRAAEKAKYQFAC